MYRFLLRPRWIVFHLVVVAGVILMVNLGFWQLRRHDERQGFNARVEEQLAQPAVPLDDVLTDATAASVEEWRLVTAAGRYLPEESVTVVNRSQGGIAGDMVVTPLLLDDERILLVERGFVPLADAPAAAPAGVVEVVGRLRPSQERRRGGLSDPATGPLETAQRIDVERLAGQLSGPVIPGYVELVSSSPAETGRYPAPVAPPELTDGPHLSYAGQWFIFSACAVVGWVLAVRHSLGVRRNELRPRAATATTPEPAGTAPPSSR